MTTPLRQGEKIIPAHKNKTTSKVKESRKISGMAEVKLSNGKTGLIDLATAQRYNIHDFKSLSKALKTSGMGSNMGLSMTELNSDGSLGKPHLLFNQESPGLRSANRTQFGGGVFSVDPAGFYEDHKKVIGPGSDNFNMFLGSVGAMFGANALMGGLGGAAGGLGGAGGLSAETLAGIPTAFEGATAAEFAPLAGEAVGGGSALGASQAIDGSAQWLYDVGANSGAPGYNPALTSGVASGGAAGSSLAAGGGAFDNFISGLSNVFKNVGINSGQIIPALANFLIQRDRAGNLQDAGNAAANRQDPLMHPTRQPFINNATNLMTNPKSYQMTPYAQGQMNLLQDQFTNNVSKYGPSGTSFIKGWMEPAQNIMSQDFFNLFNANAQAGGLFMAPGPTGQLQYQGDAGAADARARGLAGFGTIFNPNTNSTRSFDPSQAENIFSKFAQGMSGTNIFNQ